MGSRRKGPQPSTRHDDYDDYDVPSRDLKMTLRGFVCCTVDRLLGSRQDDIFYCYCHLLELEDEMR